MNKQTTRREFLSATGSAIAGGAVFAASAGTVSGQSPAPSAAPPQRPKFDRVDVLVVGGGPAGIGAALGAARKGAKTLLIENHSFFGGVPEKLDGLLTAGRCISATHAGAAAGKSMGNCMATGHAAGVAGAMCAAKNCQPRELKVAELQAALRADGVDLAAKDREQTWLK
jgi:succinate dehydrogenase/fumarate reductase flavoprotein subunit